MDHLNYRNNLQSFIEKIKNSYVEGVCFVIDSNPAFQKNNIPFDFKYCYSVHVITENDSFNISTSMTETGIETFWILQSEKVKDNSNYLVINSSVKSVKSESGHDNYAFRIRIEFEQNLLSIYSGEIYVKADGSLEYKINDEMILVIEGEKDAKIFERMANYP